MVLKKIETPKGTVKMSIHEEDNNLIVHVFYLNKVKGIIAGYDYEAADYSAANALYNDFATSF